MMLAFAGVRSVLQKAHNAHRIPRAPPRLLIDCAGGTFGGVGEGEARARGRAGGIVGLGTPTAGCGALSGDEGLRGVSWLG